MFDEGEAGTETLRGLAPAATPSVVLGLLSIVLGPLPVAGLILGWLGFFRSQQAAFQLDSDDRLEGQGLQTAGCILSIIGMVMGVASTVVWLTMLIRIVVS